MKPKFARTTQVTHIIQTSTQETIILQLTQTLSFFLSKYHILNKPNKKSLLHNNSFRWIRQPRYSNGDLRVPETSTLQLFDTKYSEEKMSKKRARQQLSMQTSTIIYLQKVKEKPLSCLTGPFIFPRGWKYYHMFKLSTNYVNCGGITSPIKDSTSRRCHARDEANPVPKARASPWNKEEISAGLFVPFVKWNQHAMLIDYFLEM